MKNLVELMAEEMFNKHCDVFPEGTKGLFTYLPDGVKAVLMSQSQDMLSVVKENIGEIAKVCPHCNGNGEDKHHEEQRPCHFCDGSGVIARTEGDV
jgi:hypothetical protein